MEQNHEHDDAYTKYREKSRNSYRDKIHELEFRSHRAAMMNYYVAATNGKIVNQLEVYGGIFGAVSLGLFGSFILDLKKHFDWLPMEFIGTPYFALFCALVALVMQILANVSSLVLPSFSRRAQQHNEVASDWQKLAQKAESYRIQMDDPRCSVSNFGEWYKELFNERAEICKKAIIRLDIYESFNDLKLVIDRLKIRYQMFREFKGIQEIDRAGDSDD